MLATAWLDYHVNFAKDCVVPSLRRPSDTKNVRKDVMGVITTQPDIVQRMFEAGIPVWYMRLAKQLERETIVLNWVLPKHAELRNEMGNLFKWQIYRGVAGERHMAAIMNVCSRYLDLEYTAFPQDLVNPALGPYNPPNRPAQSQQAGPSRTQSSNHNARYGPCK